MKQLALLVCILFCQVLLSQELITDITNEHNRDHIDFKKIEGINHISVRDYFGNFLLYHIDSNGEATLSYSEPLFTEPYTSFLENDNYLLYVRGDKAYIYDIVLREERIITTNESSDETKWVSIGNDKAILSYLRGATYEQKIIDLSSMETVSTAGIDEHYYAIKNNILYRSIKQSTGAPTVSCFLRNLETNEEVWVHSLDFSTGSFSGKHFVYNKNGNYTIVDQPTLKKTTISPDISKVELFNIWNDIALYQSNVFGEARRLYETNLLTDETIEIEKLSHEVKRIRVNDSLYLVKKSQEYVLLNKNNEHSTVYSIQSSFPSESIISDKYIVLRDNHPRLIDVTTKSSITIPIDAQHILLMTDFSEDRALVLLRHSSNGSSIYTLNKQTLELTEYTELDINKFGLENELIHKYSDEILLLDDDVYIIKEDNYIQANDYRVVQSQTIKHSSEIDKTIYWSEIDTAAIHLYKYNTVGRQLIKSIPDSLISTEHEITSINFLEKDEKLLAAIYSDHKTHIYDLTNDDPHLLAQTDNGLYEILAYDNGNILYGSHDLYTLYPDGTTVLQDNIDAIWIYPRSYIKQIGNEKIIVARNGLFRLVSGEIELIAFTQNGDHWSFSGSNYIIVADQNKYYKYTISNTQLEQIWAGYKAEIVSNHEVLLSTSDQSSLPQVYDANEDKYYLLNDYVELAKIDSWYSDNNRIILTGYDSFSSPIQFKIIEIDKETTTVQTKANIDVPTVESSTFRWSGDEGLLRVGNKAYVCDESFVLREISDFRAAQGNIHLVDGKYYLFGIHPTLGRQVYYISDLSQVMVNTTDYDQATNTLKIYPNPAQEYIQLEGINEHASYSIYDINGKRIAHSTMKQSQISISQLSAGTYFIHVMNGETLSVGKVVVVR